MALLEDGFGIVVGSNTSPEETFQLLTHRDGSDDTVPVDITGYAFRLCVYSYFATEDEQSTERHEWFRLDATLVDETKGTFKFTFTAADHTNFPPGTYAAEIRWAEAGADIDEEITDSRGGTYTVRFRGTFP